ncbi:MAG: NADH-quinone oxidoreductase subunit N [Desulfobulbus propionicus]|nr:MAG: NADH-quinone oxidoreductase subunit N [Desulfobulbus propionicus]
MAILPELVLLCGATFYFVVSLLPAPDVRLLRRSSILIGLLVFVSTCFACRQESVLFFGSYVVDGYSQMFKLLIGFTLAVVMVFGMQLKGINDEVRAEYSLFLFLSVLGLMMLVSSVELTAIFISLELSSFALYIMVPMRDDQTGTRSQMEAGIKYLLFGVMATGFMLFGMSYLFGLTGSTYLEDIIPALDTLGQQPAVLVALLLILGGFFYKLAVFPMQFWVPDVYEGASNDTAGFIATVPKLGAVALIIRFMTFPMGQPEFMAQFLGAIALCSMFYGNLCALVQKDVKRMLGFSGIAHAGFVLLGLLSFKAEGYGLAIFYIFGYVIMNLACFLVISAVSQKGENVKVDDFNGLYKRQPVLALILSTALFALAGIPPFVGFMGKFFLLTSTLQQDHLVIVVLASINTALALYYYLCVVKAAYTEEPEKKPSVTVSPLTSATGILLVVLIIIMGALPSKFIGLADRVVQGIM